MYGDTAVGEMQRIEITESKNSFVWNGVLNIILFTSPSMNRNIFQQIRLLRGPSSLAVMV